jgi:hypothetical protein
MTLFTWFMSVATSWIIGSSEGGVERWSCVTVAGMRAPLALAAHKGKRTACACGLSPA